VIEREKAEHELPSPPSPCILDCLFTAVYSCGCVKRGSSVVAGHQLS
jgi:hypothetical protein